MSVPEWVTGCDRECCEQRARASEMASFDPWVGSKVQGYCTCGHANLRVHAFPRPQGEGVLCLAVDRRIYKKSNGKDVRMDQYAHPEGTFFPLSERFDAPIREAWERLCEESKGWFNGPPDGLYLFVEDQLLPIEDVTERYRRLEVEDHPRPENVLQHLLAKYPDAQSLRFTSGNKEYWYDA